VDSRNSHVHAVRSRASEEKFPGEGQFPRKGQPRPRNTTKSLPSILLVEA